MSALIKNGYGVTMKGGRGVFGGGFVTVGNNGRINGVGAAKDCPKGPLDETVDAAGMMVLPGVINLHQHHWYNLFKGLGAGLLLEQWVADLLLSCAQRLQADDLRAAAYLSA